MGVDATVAVSQGDIMRRLRNLEKLVERLAADRSLEAASVGRGGLRLHGGGSLLVDDGGDIRVAGGRIEAVDDQGNDVFVVGTDPASIFLRQDLLDPLAAAVLGARVHTDTVDDQDTLSDQDTFTDLTPAGPEVTGVTITAGIALVLVGCNMSGVLADGANSMGGYMGVDVSGATTIAADIAKSYHLRSVNHNANGANRTEGAQASAALVLPCNPGVHTFTAKYRTLSGTTTTMFFSQRSLAVLAL